jgi:hypothetical protein
LAGIDQRRATIDPGSKQRAASRCTARCSRDNRSSSGPARPPMIRAAARQEQALRRRRWVHLHEIP